MTVTIHEKNGLRVAEMNSDSVVLDKVQDALDLMVNPGVPSPKAIILHERNINPEFFDLSTRLAGEILQKFVNYQVRLAIVGGFSDVKSESLRDFIRECNRGNHFYFMETVEDAVDALVGDRG
ncbi:MAG: DUF4180 domain-containing protein [Patescibacteria group bacterium]